MPTPIREKIVNNAAPYLRPGEQVQGAFAGQSISGWWALLTYLMIWWLRYRSVIVTDQRILVLDTGKWSMTKAKGVVAELSRTVVIGPASGLWWKCETLGERLFVHKRFDKDVLAADTFLAQSGMPVQQIPLRGSQPQGQWRHQGQEQVPSQQYGAQQGGASVDARQWQAQQWQAQAAQQQWQAQAAQQQWHQPDVQASLGQVVQLAGPDEDNRTRIRRVEPRPPQNPDV